MKSLAFLIVVLSAAVANAQFTVNFQNQMDTAARVLVTPVDGGEAIDFRLNTGRPTQFNFSGQRFNIQVIPDDEPDSGFRLFDVDLRDLSQRANGQAVTLNGDFADDVKKLVCKKRRCRARRCRCYYVTTKGERIAVGLQADLNDGTDFQIEAPKEKGGY